jgi:hypothetical protein
MKSSYKLSIKRGMLLLCLKNSRISLSATAHVQVLIVCHLFKCYVHPVQPKYYYYDDDDDNNNNNNNNNNNEK